MLEKCIDHHSIIFVCLFQILRDGRPPQVNLYGSPEQCQRARALIEDLLQERRGAGNMYR